VFRAGLSGRDVYLMIAALNYFYLSNRHTLSAFLGEKLEAPEALAHWQAFVVESVLRTVRPCAGSDSRTRRTRKKRNTRKD
jgi:hypothetical protein